MLRCLAFEADTASAIDMREALIRRHGGPDVFELRERHAPEPGAGEVRIHVRAAGVNFADILGRMGLYPDAPRGPYVPGYEVAGVVDTVGAGVTRVVPGERVVALTRFGGYADTVVVPADYVFATPRDTSDAEAAALPVAHLTALVALYRMANVQAGEIVLVRSAGGGVGLAAADLCRLRRATVVGIASGGKLEAIRRLGVDHPIDRRADVPREVMRITGGRGADVVLDAIGGASFAESYRLLAPLGRLIIFGVSAAAPTSVRQWWPVLRTLWAMPRFKALSLINRNRGVFGLNVGHLWDERRHLASAMEFLLGELATRRLAPRVDRTFPLDDVAEAHRYIQERKNVGKVILTI
ncbi:MAG: zinc-binding dehydrogenase [Vicinamibacterales bacterium]